MKDEKPDDPDSRLTPRQRVLPSRADLQAEADELFEALFEARAPDSEEFLEEQAIEELQAFVNRIIAAI